MIHPFSEPDIVLRLIPKDTKECFSVEQGVDFIFPSDEMSQEDLIEYARQHDLLGEDYDYFLEDGSFNYESLRDDIRVQEEDYPSTMSSPNGRAFDFLYGFAFPKDIRISLIDGDAPGRDYQGVEITGLDSIVALQRFLEAEGYEVNFEFVDEACE